MDEPFAALDEITRDTMRYQLLDVWSETRTTVVFVTHSIAEAVVLSDRVITMAARPGRVAAVEQIKLARPRTEDMEDSDRVHLARPSRPHVPAGQLGGTATVTGTDGRFSLGTRQPRSGPAISPTSARGPSVGRGG